MADYNIGARGTKLEWQTHLAALPIMPPHRIANWLVQANRLSPFLKKHYQKVVLTCLSEGWQQPNPDEMARLNGISGLAWIRRILLTGDGQPCSYGRTVIPYETYDHYREILEDLGSHLIGEHFLYQNPNFTRSAFEYAIDVSQAEPHWYRRSVFDCDGYPLLLIERILPTICDFPDI